MGIKVLSLLMAICTLAGGSVTLPVHAASFACNTPQTRLAHPKWYREGGYCEIAADLRSAIPYGHDGSEGTCQARSTRVGAGCFIGTTTIYNGQVVDVVRVQGGVNGYRDIFVRQTN